MFLVILGCYGILNTECRILFMLIINVLSDYCKIYEVFHFELLNKIEDL